MVDARKPTAAGVYYPSAAGELERSVRELLEAASGGPQRPAVRGKRPQAIVAPHGRLAVSGAIAAAAWARVAPRAPQVRRVVVLGPAHHAMIAGVAAPFAEAFETPMGVLAVDRIAVEVARRWPLLSLADAPHEHEHSLEMQLPFVQSVLQSPAIVPLLVGDADEDELTAVIDAMWSETTLIVVSTDLSQYHDASTASQIDDATARAVEMLDPGAIGPDQACGWLALRALLRVAGARDWSASRVQLGAGSPWSNANGAGEAETDEVTGFGAFVLG
jgi:AmmeMemoRadiSam system protein B